MFQSAWRVESTSAHSENAEGSTVLWVPTLWCQLLSETRETQCQKYFRTDALILNWKTDGGSISFSVNTTVYKTKLTHD
jgi:hypothetical protein